MGTRNRDARRRRIVARCRNAGLVLVAVVLAGCTASRSPAAPSSTAAPASSSSSTTASPAPGTPTASSDSGDTATYPTVGVLFSHGVQADHGCTASVVASMSGDTVLTAAHCVNGTGAGVEFVPAYRRGRTPFGVWQVTGAYAPPLWQHGYDPHADFVVLTVADHDVDGHQVSLASRTGAESLGLAPAEGSDVTVVGYTRGRDDVPVSCRTRVYLTGDYPSIDCHGFANGSSGSPWLTDDAAGPTVVRGVIGGLNQGGCHEYTSHTTPFTTVVAELLQRAQQARKPDTVSGPAPSDC